MSSPHLNNLIIIGCMLTYLSVVFLGLDSGLSSIAAFPYICTARAWLLMAGFSLAFGAMFSKTWRVHSIFTDLKLNKKVCFAGAAGAGVVARDGPLTSPSHPLTRSILMVGFPRHFYHF